MALDNTRTAQEQKVANLLRLLGFSLKTDFRPRGREFDVFGFLGPITLAVECKDFSQGGIGKSHLEEFSSKIRQVGNLSGIFVANRYTRADEELLNSLGIAYWTTTEVDKELARQRVHLERLRPVLIDQRVYDLFSALGRYAVLWEDYIEDWPIPHEIDDTPVFVDQGLIRVTGEGHKFRCERTADGEVFFNQWNLIRDLLPPAERMGRWEDQIAAAHIIQSACSWDNVAAPAGEWDRIMLSSTGIHRTEDMQLTQFGRLLSAVIQETIRRNPESGKQT